MNRLIIASLLLLLTIVHTNFEILKKRTGELYSANDEIVISFEESLSAYYENARNLRKYYEFFIRLCKYRFFRYEKSEAILSINKISNENMKTIGEKMQCKIRF